MADIAVMDDALGANALSLSGADAASFEIVGTALYLKAGVTLDYESKTSYAVSVNVEDFALSASQDSNGSGPFAQASQNFTLAVTNVNEAPSLALKSTTSSLAENASTVNAIKIADIAVVDDALGANFLSLSGADAGSFVIVGTELFLKAGIALDYETKASYAVSVNVDDPAIGGTPDASQVFTLALTDVNEDVTVGKLITGTKSGDVIGAQNDAAATLKSTLGNDTIHGGDGDDIIYGLAGDDILTGDAGNDVLYGGDGNDILSGGPGSDALHGGDGDDKIIISTSDQQQDTFDGGAGIDTISVTGTAGVLLFGFDAAASSIEIWQGNGHAVVGSNAADTFDFSGLIAVSGLSRVEGGWGADAITGSKFADDLRGNAGDDRIVGGAGNDVLSGGEGNDTFAFASGFGRDTISDFNANCVEHDMIEFSKDLFSNFEEILAAAHEMGPDLVITVSPTDAITLANFSLSKLSVDDFRFV